jgi:hypothetical protein
MPHLKLDIEPTAEGVHRPDGVHNGQAHLSQQVSLQTQQQQQQGHIQG